MQRETYGEWHTLTIELDSEDDDGNPAPSYMLAHPASCPPSDPEYPQFYRCWVDDLVGEFADQPKIMGLPTDPGVYRVRAWGTSGDWAGSYYIDPDSGVEVEELEPASTEESTS